MFYDFIDKYTDIFVEKVRKAFAWQKLFTIFSTKNLGILQIYMFEILTKRQLTTSLVLNNRTLVSLMCCMLPEGLPVEPLSSSQLLIISSFKFIYANA